ncbi:hypothetical protein [Nesterenkonia sandarakina]|uniref:AAA domain-containing protein n=1 Tax=Nesterenkonia sandarakina TaxID=272918 RepID=A0A7Z0E7B7_9MICC|nr:hypothetical protein [Nesterenkonia sandarakina]NYJ15722.1 hypothetical protein [Nesterenkonia sandarakina]
MPKQIDEVFGVSTSILSDSYVDRGDLDEKITSYLRRDNHIAIRGASKTGKSWLRQKVIPNALVVQCRLNKTVEDIYREALGQLGIRLEISQSATRSLSGTVEAQTEFGTSLIGKVSAKLGITGSTSKAIETQAVRQNINDLDFICQLLRESGKRLVIEDFHYLNHDERKRFAFDLKAMWDLELFVVVVGVWSDTNLLLHLNSDLTGRVREVSVLWSESDLLEILRRGSRALNLQISPKLATELVSISYKNAGILQRITLDSLDEAGITGGKAAAQNLDSPESVSTAAMFYAEELNSVYQTFAQNVSAGIKKRSNSTGIYAHALAVVLAAEDQDLIEGVPASTIFATAHARESRIQQGNLKTALGNIERLQIDEDGRGLVLTFADNKVRAVDQQLLLYRRFATVRWPWEDMIAQADAAGEDYAAPTSGDLE